MFYTRKYVHTVNADVGGGKSSGAYSSDTIHIDEEIFEEILTRIKDNNEEIVPDGQSYVEPDPQCLLNPVIPDYQEADHIAMDMFLAMKSETRKITELMKKIEDNYISVNDEKKAELEKQSGTYTSKSGRENMEER